MLFKENSAESLATQDCSKFCHWVAAHTCPRLLKTLLILLLYCGNLDGNFYTFVYIVVAKYVSHGRSEVTEDVKTVACRGGLFSPALTE